MSKSEFRAATLAHILLEEDAVGAVTQKFRSKLRNLGSMSVLARDDLASLVRLTMGCFWRVQRHVLPSASNIFRCWFGCARDRTTSSGQSFV